MFNDELKLRPVMRDSYLIQRLQKPAGWRVGDKVVDNPFSFGGGLKNGGLTEAAMSQLRDIFSFDYMGAAEFEWGAVPAALSFLARQTSENQVVAGIMVLEGGEKVYVVSPISYFAEVQVRIRRLYKDEYSLHLKEHCGLKNSLVGKNEWEKKNVGWFELDNGYVFFTDYDMAKKFCDLFGLVIPKEA